MQVSLGTGILTNSPALLYIPALFTETFDRLGRIIVFASKIPEQESNSSYTARADPFPSALSTRPTLLSSLSIVSQCFQTSDSSTSGHVRIDSWCSSFLSLLPYALMFIRKYSHFPMCRAQKMGTRMCQKSCLGE